MGFSVSIEAGWGAEKLRNCHPNGYLTDGKAVFAFLSGLLTYCDVKLPNEADSLLKVYDWYRELDQLHEQPLCETCHALLDCMWGDGGDSTVYHDDEYAFFVYRTRNSGIKLTEEQFQQMIQRGYDSWQPIKAVTDSVRILLDTFHQESLAPLEGFFLSDDTVPDFEALLANLEWLMKRGNETVRLNFS